MAKFSVCRIYKVTLWLNFSYNYSVNLLQILHLYIHPSTTPWRIWVYPWRISWKLKPYPQSIHISIFFFTLPHKKSSIFIAYYWRIALVVNRGGTDITVKPGKPWTPKIFLECYCVAWKNPIRHEKTELPARVLISVKFCG